MVNRKKWTAYDLAFIGVMAAIVYVVTMFRIPLGQSKIHLANAICLLSGLLLGPLAGGLAAGLGSALYDALAGGYDFVNVMITFVSKFAMAAVCAILADKAVEKKSNMFRVVLACIAGALTYVALYMIKTWIFQLFVYHVESNAVWIVMTEKLVPSLLNAVAAVIVAPILYTPLKKIVKENRNRR